MQARSWNGLPPIFGSRSRRNNGVTIGRASCERQGALRVTRRTRPGAKGPGLHARPRACAHNKPAECARQEFWGPCRDINFCVLVCRGTSFVSRQRRDVVGQFWVTTFSCCDRGSHWGVATWPLCLYRKASLWAEVVS